jgi:hypothetical protein
MVDIAPIEEIAENYGRSAEKGSNEYEKHLLRRGKSISEACEVTDRYFTGVVESSRVDPNKLKRHFDGERSQRIAEALAEQR